MLNKKINVKNIFSNVITFVLVIVLGILLFGVFQIKVQKKPYFNFCGYTAFQVVTGSMSGSIEIGDIVIVKLNAEIIEKDIIVYEKDNNFITHRLIQKNDNELITKGDANNSEDEPIQKEDVIGKVVFVVRNINLIKQLLLTPQIIIATIVLIVLIFIIRKIN